jgi:hypothetical protein
MSPAGEDLKRPVITRWIGRLSGVAPPLRTPERIVLAAIEWQEPEPARIDLRAHLVTGAWTPWVSVSGLGHGGQRGEATVGWLVGEPVWTGPADAVQLRSAAAVEGLNLHLVSAAAVADPQHVAHARQVASAAPDRLRIPANRAGAAAAAGLPLAEPNLPAGPGQPPIIARHAWAGDLLPRAVPFYGDIRLAFVHHSVNANVYSSAQVPAMLRSIYYFHTHVRGWNDIGYNFAVDAYGRIWEARAGGIDRPVVGAQAGGYNLESFGAVLLGDFAVTLPTAAARQALARLIAWKLALHGAPATGRVTVEVDPSDAHYTRFRPGQHVSLPRVAAHRDGCTTDCPGGDMYVNGMPALRSVVARLTAGRLHGLTLAVGAGKGSAHALAPYPIAPGTRVKSARDLELETVTVSAGSQLPLHGALRSFAGVPVRAATILLQDLSASRGSEHESSIARTVTGHDGAWAAVLTPRSNLLLRALHADAPAAVSALIVIGVAPELTLGLTPSASSAIHALGTVSPVKPHVLLEVTAAGGKHRVVLRRTVTPDADGGFAVELRLPPGRYWLTARTAADAANVAGTSPPVALHI